MKQKIIMAIASLFAVSVIVPAAVILPRHTAAAASSAAQTQQAGYIVRDYNGRIAVFGSAGGGPQQVFDVYTNQLPGDVQQQLKKGIHVRTHDDLLALIENYTS